MIDTRYSPNNITSEMVPQSEIDTWLNQPDNGKSISKSGPNEGKRQKLFACVGIVHRLSKDGNSVEFAILNCRCPINTHKVHNKFPGGGSEFGEKALDTVTREVVEELEIPLEIVKGLDFEVLRNCAIYKKNNGEIVNIQMFFLAKNPLKNFELPEFNGNDDFEIKGREWLTLDKLLSVTEYPGLFYNHRKALPEVIKKLVDSIPEYGWVLRKFI